MIWNDLELWRTEDNLKQSRALKILLEKIWWTIYSSKEERRVAHHCEQNWVTVLRLPGVALLGQHPNGIFRNLTRLCTLSLRLNALTGSLPSVLAACVNLCNLYLQGNLFTSDNPEFLWNGGTRILKTQVPHGFFSTSYQITYKSRLKNSSFILELKF